MITVFNSSNYAQQVFFNEAYAYLALNKKLNAQELAAGKFLSLDGYFAHIKDLVEIQPSYVLIPSDEAPFEIDANTRQIKIPNNFSKCAGVVGDNMCEIITFTVDRYFDYVDLATAQICIQWQAGEEKGVSHIGLRDLTTVSGKIRFGWPITEALTKNAGNITFAVRFYIEKEERPGENKFVYLFNTLPASIPIKQGLTVIGEEGAVIEQGASDLFKAFISNSNNPSYAMPQPVDYVDNIPGQSKLDDSANTLQLKAQATTKGDGFISYKWYFKPGATLSTEANIAPVPITSGEISDVKAVYNIDDKVYEPTAEKDHSKLSKNKQYYYLKDAENNLYDRVLVNEDGKFVKTDGTLIADNTQLYERFSVLTILNRTKTQNPDLPDITGVYYVEAINSVGDTQIQVKTKITDANGKEVDLEYHVPGINSTTPLHSNHCYLPVPNDVKISKAENDLPNTRFTNASKKTTLTVIPDADGGNPLRTYTWYKTNDSVTSLTLLEDGKWEKPSASKYTMLAKGENLSSKEVTSPGWYWVDINSKLNRDERNGASLICRVVDEVEAPEITSMKFRIGDNSGNYPKDYTPIYEYDLEQKKYVAKNTDAIGLATYGAHIELVINISDAFNSLLKSDSLEYTWYQIDENGITREVVNTIPVDEVNPAKVAPGENSTIVEDQDVKTNILKVRCNANVTDATKGACYYCKITNTLSDQSKSIAYTNYGTGDGKLPTFDVY